MEVEICKLVFAATEAHSSLELSPPAKRKMLRQFSLSVPNPTGQLAYSSRCR